MTEEYKISESLLKGFVSLGMERELAMAQYGGSWKGASDSKGRQFRFALRTLGEKSDLAFIDGQLCWYNGKVYERVDMSAVKNAYIDMIDHFQIGTWVLKEKLFFETFLRGVREKHSMQSDMSLFAFSNGVLDLRDGHTHFYPFSREFPVTVMHGFRYKEGAVCPKWQAFLREVLPDKAQRVLLQMSMGLGLCNRSEIGKVEQCLVLYGAGGNGKGVVYNTMREIFGEELMSCVSVRDLCSMNDSGLRARYELRGKVFNWNSDENSDFLHGVDPAVFKRIVSGEPVNDRRIGGDIQENRNLPYMAFNTNHLPKMGELTDAMMRRWQIINFGVTIDRERMNPDLIYELLKERSGIFNWIVRGMKELRRKKYRMPISEESERAKLRMLFDDNPIRSFIESYGIRTQPKLRGEIWADVPRKVVLDALNTFVKANGGRKEYSAETLGWSLRSICNGNSKVGTHMVKGENCYKFYGCAEQTFKNVIVLGESFKDREKFREDDKCYISNED